MRIPKLRRHSTGHAFVELHGRRFYLGPYDSPEAKQRYAQVLAANAAGLSLQPGRSDYYSAEILAPCSNSHSNILELMMDASCPHDCLIPLGPCKYLHFTTPFYPLLNYTPFV